MRPIMFVAYSWLFFCFSMYPGMAEENASDRVAFLIDSAPRNYSPIRRVCTGHYGSCNSDSDCCDEWVCISKKCE
jgi:hypothetical protein